VTRTFATPGCGFRSNADLDVTFQDPDGGAGVHGPADVPDPIPEADSEVTADAWEESNVMEREDRT